MKFVKILVARMQKSDLISSGLLFGLAESLNET